MILKDDNGKELPKKVQKRVNDFINHLPKVNWFKPSPSLKKEDVEKQIKFTLECFGVKAGIEYRKLKTKEDWASARDSAWASAMDSAWASARDSARASAWASAWASTWASAWASARDSARASQEILLEDNEDFKKEYPNGAFKQLLKLWEMGLYPVGILKNKKFVIYVPLCKEEFPFKI